MKKEKGIILIVLIAIIVCIILIGGIIFLVINSSDKKENTIIKNNIENNNIIAEENAENNINNSADNLNIWNGTYQKENMQIQLYRISENRIEISITKLNNEKDDINLGVYTNSFQLDLDSEKELNYNNNSFRRD